jgi:hypothetical protein
MNSQSPGARYKSWQLLSAFFGFASVLQLFFTQNITARFGLQLNQQFPVGFIGVLAQLLFFHPRRELL